MTLFSIETLQGQIGIITDLQHPVDGGLRVALWRLTGQTEGLAQGGRDHSGLLPGGKVAHHGPSHRGYFTVHHTHSVVSYTLVVPCKQTQLICKHPGQKNIAMLRYCKELLF